MDIKFIKRKKGTVLLFSGRQYYKLRTYKNGSSYWTCSRLKKEKCRGFITLKDNKMFKCTDHLCTADNYKNEVDIAVDELKHKVKDTVNTIPEMYAEMKTSLVNQEPNLVNKVPTFDSVKTVLYTNRKKTCFNHFKDVTVPDKFQAFILADYNTEKRRIIVFCSENNYQIVEKSDEFFGDGTYFSCPTPFKQLYCIFADLSKSISTTNAAFVAYALMTDKTEESYYILFSMIKSRLDWSPKIFHVDFEIAASKALLQTFPEAQIVHCFYHFTNSQWRRAKKLKIKSKDGKRVVGLCAALALLPADEIEEGWQYIKFDCSVTTKIEKYLKYFEKTWLKNKISDWSVFGQRHRTNNIVESFNTQLNKSISSDHGCTVTLVKKENSAPKPSPRRQELILRDEFIMKFQMELLHNEISVGYFLNKLR